ncbi:hypothetical protein GH733_010478, partial [Mirounga leonina]
MPIAIVTLAEAGGPDTFYEAETRYRGHVSVVGPGHSLQISNLSWKDAGPYRAHTNLRSSRITRTREYQLQVYEQLARPRVTLSSRIGESGRCIFILTCEAESRGGSVTYSCLPLGPRTVVSRGGSVLSVSSRLRDRALTFTCVVKNPVSTSSSLPVSVPSSCPHHEGWGLLHHPDLLPATGRRGCSVQMGTPWPGGSYVPWGNHSPCLLETRGQRQLSLHGQQPGASSPLTLLNSLLGNPFPCLPVFPFFSSPPFTPVPNLWSLFHSASFLPCSLKKEFLIFSILGALQIEQIDFDKWRSQEEECERGHLVGHRDEEFCTWAPPANIS